MVANLVGRGKDVRRMNKLCVIMLVLALWAGCKSKEPEETYTKGSAHIGTSDAVLDIAAYVGYQYGEIHHTAFISFWRHPTQALIDSLLSGRVEEIIIDRALMSAESSAFATHQQKLFTYPVAYYPTYLLVSENLTVSELDSVGLKRILEGTATNWQEFGGADIPITPYAPLPGEGAWMSLVSYFGELDSVAAVVCSTNARMMELAANDPGALLIYSKKPIDARGFKKLIWFDGEARVAANAKTILEEPRWPFMTTFTYVTTHMKSDVAAGYLTFIVSNDGQKMVMKEGYRPASVPVRVIQLKTLPEGADGATDEDTSK